MKTILALGNPGAEYAGTRHNIGFMLADFLAKEWSVPWRAGQRLLWAQSGEWRLVKPLTWMNASGAALAELGGEFGPEELLVAADEVNLPLGRLRLRAGGSCGGHNGMASVELALGRRDYQRLRLGVGGEAPVLGAELVDFVLGEFAPQEQDLLQRSVAMGAQAAECWLREGLQAAQDGYNGVDLRQGGMSAQDAGAGRRAPPQAE